MTDITLWSLVRSDITQAITVFGGVSVVAALLARWVGDLLSAKTLAKQKAGLDAELVRLKAELDRVAEQAKADISKEFELNKLRLKKQELLFSKELDAAAAMISLRRDINPTYDHPDQGWEDTMEKIASNLVITEKNLSKYILTYGNVLPSEALIMLENCLEFASNKKFDIHEYGCFTNQIGSSMEVFLKSLLDMEKKFLAHIRDGF